MSDEKWRVRINGGPILTPADGGIPNLQRHRICGEDADRRWSLIHGTCISAQDLRYSAFCDPELRPGCRYCPLWMCGGLSAFMSIKAWLASGG
jgi:hypothetical protein